MAQDTENKLVTAFQKQTEKVIYFCSAENISPNLAVHEIRKSFKRLRALLYFYTDCPIDYPEKLKQAIKNAGKYLSPIRESFVNIQIFDRISGGNNLVPERKIKQAKDVFTEKNRIIVTTEFIENGLTKNILELMENFESEFEMLNRECPSSKQQKEQLSISFSKSFEIYRQLETEFTPEKLHDLRKILKRLWYQIDYIKYLHPRYFRLKSDQLNKITEQLGDDHDLFIFNYDLQQGEFELLPEELTILEKQVEHQRELNMHKLSPRLKQFFNEPPEIFDRKLERIFKIS